MPYNKVISPILNIKKNLKGNLKTPGKRSFAILWAEIFKFSLKNIYIFFLFEIGVDHLIVSHYTKGN